MFKVITFLLSGLFLLNQGNQSTIHRLDIDFDYLAGVYLVGNRYSHPFKRMIGNRYLHMGLLIREVCSDKDCVVIMISEEDEMPVLVKAFGSVVAVAQIVCCSLLYG